MNVFSTQTFLLLLNSRVAEFSSGVGDSRSGERHVYFAARF